MKISHFRAWSFLSGVPREVVFLEYIKIQFNGIAGGDIAVAIDVLQIVAIATVVIILWDLSLAVLNSFSEIYLHFLSFLNTESAQINGILPHGRQGIADLT